MAILGVRRDVGSPGGGDRGARWGRGLGGWVRPIAAPRVCMSMLVCEWGGGGGSGPAPRFFTIEFVDRDCGSRRARSRAAVCDGGEGVGELVGDGAPEQDDGAEEVPQEAPLVGRQRPMCFHTRGLTQRWILENSRIEKI